MAAPPPAPPAPAPAPKGPSWMPVVSMVLGIVAFLFAVIPPVAGVTFLFAIAAIVFGIIGLIRKSGRTAMSLVGIIVGAVAWLISIIVVTVTLVGSASTLKSDHVPPAPVASDTASAQASTPAVETPTAAPSKAAAPASGIGATLTSREKLTVTLNSVTCGISHAGDQYLGADAKGQFCEIKLTMTNGGDEEVDISDSDISGKIGTADYDVTSGPSDYDGDIFEAKMNPGLTAHATVYIDIPAGAALDSVSIRRTFSLDSELAFKLK